MFEIANPWVFIALPIPFIIWFLMPKSKFVVTSALKVPFFALLQHAISTKLITFNTRKILWFLFTIYTFLILALSGPRHVGAPRPLSHESYNIILALDVSPSMGINDMALNGEQVTRLDAVKKAAKQFILNRSGDKIGLILFGERAYLLTPLTFDKENLLMRLDDATVGLAGKSTSTGDAIGLAIKKFQNIPAKGRMIVLLTDGASNSGVLSPIRAAEIARDNNIKIYTIGLHSKLDPQSFSGMFLNANGMADLDEETLQKVAKITNGQYFRATSHKSLQNIYQSIDKMAKVSQEQKTIRPQYDYYPWFLVFGFIQFLYLIAKAGGVRINIRGDNAE